VGGHVLVMLEGLIDYSSGHDGVSWVTMRGIDDDFRRRTPLWAGRDGAIDVGSELQSEVLTSVPPEHAT
jgi:hypothetical protein